MTTLNLKTISNADRNFYGITDEEKQQYFSASYNEENETLTFYDEEGNDQEIRDFK